MTTVLEALMNAQINFQNLGRSPMVAAHPFFILASEQLANGIKSIEQGKGVHDEVLTS